VRQPESRAGTEASRGSKRLDQSETISSCLRLGFFSFLFASAELSGGSHPTSQIQSGHDSDETLSGAVEPQVFTYPSERVSRSLKLLFGPRKETPHRRQHTISVSA
jgi:hypothetical protein